MAEAELGQWLTLAEVASRTGRHIDAVRSWAQRGRRSGRLRTQKNNRHELQVWLAPEAETELAQGIALAASVNGSAGDEGTHEALAEARPRIEDLTKALAEAERRQDEAEAKANELRITLARAEGEMQGVRTGATAALDAAKLGAAAEVASMRQQLETEVAARNAVIEEVKAALDKERERLDHERERGDRLAAELAAARRPWLVRMIEAVRGR